MTKIYFSDRTRTFVRRVFEALLTVAYQEKGDRDKKIKLKCEWSSVRQIKFEIGKEDLKKLVGNATEEQLTNKIQPATEKQFTNEIQPALVGYLSEILGILTEISDPTGSGLREFLLDLWDEDKDNNLTRFDDEWDKKANEHKKSKPKSSKSSRTATSAITPLPQQRQLFGATQIRDIPDWVGRDELLTELHADFAKGRKMLVLFGQGGIGKTSLAVKLMSNCGVDTSSSILPATCPYDNALYCEVNESDSFDSLVAKFLTAFGMSADCQGATPAQVIEMILTRLHQERWLVTIDNLESLMEPGSSKSKSPDVGNLLNRLAYGGHNSQIIITSRKLPDDIADRRGTKIDFRVVRTKNIRGISHSDSVRLIKELGAKDSQKDLEWIAKRVGGNIFVLKLLADYSRKKPGILREKKNLVTKEAKPIVRAQWELQSAPTQDLLQRMCVLRIGMDAAALTILRLMQPHGEEMESTPEAEEVTEDLLAGLVNCGLLEETYDDADCENLYILHRLMAETLQAMFEDDLKRLWQYAARLYGSFDRLPEYRSLEDLQFLLEEAHFHWESRSIETSYSIVIKDILPKLMQWCYWELGELWLDRILIVDTESGNLAGMASCYVALGNIAKKRGDYSKAESFFGQSLIVYKELDNLAGIAASLGLLGEIFRNLGNYLRAEELFNLSLEVYEKLGNRAKMAIYWGYLGENELYRGDLEAAETLLNRALTAMKDFQMTWEIAIINWRLAQLYRARDNEEKAQQYYAIAHALLTKMGAKGDLDNIEEGWL